MSGGHRHLGFLSFVFSGVYVRSARATTNTAGGSEITISHLATLLFPTPAAVNLLPHPLRQPAHLRGADPTVVSIGCKIATVASNKHCHTPLNSEH